MSESTPKIYAAIVATMKDIGAVGKDQVNTYDKYKFRGIDDVYNALSPAMTKNGIFVVPNLLKMDQEDRSSKNGGTQIHTTLDMEYTFYAVDGSNVKAHVVGEAMDRSDKSVNKAMSAAFKYACFQTFCIPTEEMKDADAESPEAGQRVEKQKVQHRPDQPRTQDDLELPMTDEQRMMIIKECERTGNVIETMEQAKHKEFKDFTRLDADSIIRQLKSRKTKEQPKQEMPWVSPEQVSLSDL